MVWLVLLLAAIMEVAGDAVIRKGLRGSGWGLVLAGGVILALYGVAVNTVKWDFSKLLGVYVGAFAAVSVLWGWLVFGDKVPLATWIGLAIILAGSLCIQFGQRLLG